MSVKIRLVMFAIDVFGFPMTLASKYLKVPGMNDLCFRLPKLEASYFIKFYLSYSIDIKLTV